jgi:hypothetical protein
MNVAAVVTALIFLVIFVTLLALCFFFYYYRREKETTATDDEMTRKMFCSLKLGNYKKRILELEETVLSLRDKANDTTRNQLWEVHNMF